MLVKIELLPIYIHLQTFRERKQGVRPFYHTKNSTAFDFVLSSNANTHLIALRVYNYDHLKIFPSSEGHFFDFLLPFPHAISEGVEHHFVPEIETRIEVEGNISAFKLATLKIYVKPALYKQHMFNEFNSF